MFSGGLYFRDRIKKSLLSCPLPWQVSPYCISSRLVPVDTPGTRGFSEPLTLGDVRKEETVGAGTKESATTVFCQQLTWQDTCSYLASHFGSKIWIWMTVASFAKWPQTNHSTSLSIDILAAVRITWNNVHESPCPQKMLRMGGVEFRMLYSGSKRG